MRNAVADAETPFPLKSLDRGLRVLMELGARRGSASVGQLSRDLGINKSTMSRTLQTLAAHDLISRDHDGNYRVGPASVWLANAYDGDFDLRRTIRPGLEELVAATGQTATLVIRRETIAICIDRVAAPSEAHLTMQIGGVYPIHAGATTRVLMAYMSDPALDRIPWSTLESFTERTVIDREALLVLASEVRQRGYALSTGERTIGAGSLAVPLLNSEGGCVASIGLSGLERLYKTDDSVTELLAELGRVTESASKHLESWWAHHED